MQLPRFKLSLPSINILDRHIEMVTNISTQIINDIVIYKQNACMKVMAQTYHDIGTISCTNVSGN